MNTSFETETQGNLEVRSSWQCLIKRKRRGKEKEIKDQRTVQEICRGSTHFFFFFLLIYSFSPGVLTRFH